MDPYDAILEQLKRAQTRGLETVTNRLDFVVESLEELIQEAKSSVQEAIPREPDELFPLAEVEPLVGQLREQRQAAEERAEGLTAQLAETRQQLEDAFQRAEVAAQSAAAAEAQLRAQPVVEAPPALGVSLDLFRRLDLARSQSELLKELLPALSDFVGRAVVLVMRGRTVSAWSGIGFEDPDRLRGWKGEADESAAFTRLADDAVPVRCNAATDPLLSRWLAGEPVAEEVLLVPVCLRGKIMGGLYVDRVEGRPWEPDQAQTLVALTCWLIDTLTYRQTVPSAMLGDPLDLRGEPGEAAAVEAEAEAWVSEPEEVEPVVAAAEPVEEAEPEPAAEFDARSTVRVELGAIPVVAPPAPEPVPEPEPEPELVVPVVEALPEPRPLTAEEQARHEEARRFARLLVSEIKLYNEEEVERGRVNKDLYHRLKDDFDRSKEMYEKRISPEIRAARDYFYEELLRILADGDPDALGM